jgi:hypothetical protein
MDYGVAAALLAGARGPSPPTPCRRHAASRRSDPAQRPSPDLTPGRPRQGAHAAAAAAAAEGLP